MISLNSGGFRLEAAVAAEPSRMASIMRVSRLDLEISAEFDFGGQGFWPKKEGETGSSRRHEGLGLLPLKGERRPDGDAGLVRSQRSGGAQTGSAISRDRSSLLIVLLRRRSDTRA